MADRRIAPAAVATVVATLTLVGCTHTSTSTSISTSTSTSASTSRPQVAPAAGTDTTRTGTTRTGTVTSHAIPGAATRFPARPALVYLPPAARTHPGERFPLLMLMHGTEGAPSNFVTEGALPATLDAFAATHGGRAPVVVMPDINGSTSADTECIRTTRGADVEAYLQTVVPAWALAHLPVTRDRADWGVAGISEGATCALMLGLRAATGWGYIGDYSGLRRVTVGDTDDRSATVARLFGGSRPAYDAHDPTLLLRAHRYPRLVAWLECGAADTAVRRDQAELTVLARRSLGAVHSSTIPGGHRWSTFRAIFRSALPWFWSRVA